jgi:hypothetical protein
MSEILSNFIINDQYVNTQYTIVLPNGISNSSYTITSSNLNISEILNNSILHSKSVGPCTITFIQDNNSISTTFNVKLLPLNVIATSSTIITYGNNLPAFSYTINPIPTGITIYDNTLFSNLIQNVTYNITNIDGTIISNTTKLNVGNYYVVPIYQTNNTTNYSYTDVSGSLTVQQNPITLKANAQSTTYGASLDLGNTLYTITSGSLASGDSITSVVLKYNGYITVPSTTPYNQNSYSINISNAVGNGGFNTSNYNISYTSGILTISKAILTIDETYLLVTTKTYDSTTAASVSGATITGLKNEETLNFIQSGSFSDPNANLNLINVTISYSTSSGTGLSSNYQLNKTTSSSNGYINPKPVKLSATKIYDATTDLAGYVIINTGIAGETLTYSGATVNDKNVVTINKYITSITLQNGTGTASNYTNPDLTRYDSQNNNVIIQEKTVQLSATKIYDATTDLTGNVTITTGVSNETLTYSSAIVNNPNVATTNKYITSITLDNGTGTASNYTFNSQYNSTNNYITINTAPLTILGLISASNKVYNSTTTAFLSGGTLNGLKNSETLTLTPGGSFSDPNVGTSKSITISYSISKNNGDTGLVSNYSLTQPTEQLTANITKATLTVTADQQTMYYGDSIPTLTQTITGFINGETSSVVSGTAYATVNATSSSIVGDSYIITAVNTDLSATNYNFDTLVNGTLIINQRSITLTANAQNTTYGTSFDLGNISYSITSGTLVNSDLITSVTLQYNSYRIVPPTTPHNQNGYIINISNAIGTGQFNASNYNISYISGLLSINRAPLTIDGTISASNKVYDNKTTSSLSGGILNGLMNNETLTLIPGGSFSDPNVGTSKSITISYSISKNNDDTGLVSNYSLTQPTQQLTANITKTILTVTANAQRMYYGDSIPILTQTITGFINGETSSVVLGTAYATVNATSSSIVGNSYIITAVNTGLSALNYNFDTLVNNTLIIDSRPITLKADNRSTTYGISFNLGNSAYLITSGSIAQVNNDSISSVTLQYNTSNTIPSTTNVNTYNNSIIVSNAIGNGQFNSSNYNISYLPGTLIITKTPLTIDGTISASDKTYDGTNTASLSGGTLNGLKNSEILTLTHGGSFSNSNASTSKTITILYSISDGIGINAGLANNYSFTQPTQLLTASIIPKDLTVNNIIVNNKIYNGTQTANVHSGTLNGLILGENFNLTQTGIFLNINVNTSISVTVTNAISNINGNNGNVSNYNLTNPIISGVFFANISKKMVTLSAIKIYDSTIDLTGKVTITTGVLTETLNYINASSNNANVEYANNFIKSITLTDGTNNGIASNYSLPDLTSRNANNTLTINKIDLIVIGTISPTKNYDGINNANINGGQLSGTQVNDQITLTQVGTYSTINVGTNITINMNDSVTCISKLTSQDVSTNYNFIQPIVKGTINAKTVQLSASKIYDSTTDLTGKVTIITGITGETLTYSGATVNNPNVAISNKYITSIILQNGTGIASNYTFNNQFNSVNNYVTINTTPLIILGTISASDKIYNGTTTASLSGGTLNGLKNSETLTLTPGGSFSDSNAGTSKSITISYSISKNTSDTGLVSNYALTQPIQQLIANIICKDLTIINTIVDSKIYDGTLIANVRNSTFNGLVGSENFNLTQTGIFSNINVNTLIPVTVTNVISNKNGNNGNISNYNLTNPTISSLVANIDKKTVTLSATKRYDSTTDLTGKVTITTGVLNETLNYTNASANDANVAYSNNFIKSITLTDGTNNGLASNYCLPDLTLKNINNAVTINKANLTIISQNATKNYSDNNPFYTFSYNSNDFFGNDTSANSGITGSPSYIVNDSNGTSVSRATSAGQYTIQILYNTLSSPNYSFLSSNIGILTINKINYELNWLQQYSPPTSYKAKLTDLLLKAVSKDIITSIDVGDISYYTYDSTGSLINLLPNISYLPYDGTFVIYATINVTNTNYIPISRTITKNLTIVKSRLDLKWYNPVPISSTTPLSSIQLNAICNNTNAIETYNKNIGDTLSKGLNVLNVTFKTDDPNYVYNTISTIVPINII